MKKNFFSHYSETAVFLFCLIWGRNSAPFWPHSQCQIVSFIPNWLEKNSQSKVEKKNLKKVCHMYKVSLSSAQCPVIYKTEIMSIDI